MQPPDSTPLYHSGDTALDKEAEQQRARFIAEKLNALMVVSGRSNNEIARQIYARYGYRITGTQIANIRNAKSGNPAHFLVQYLAHVLGVSILYFSDTPEDQRQFEQLQQIAELQRQVEALPQLEQQAREYQAFQQTPEYTIARRAGMLSARGRQAILEVVEAMRAAEHPESAETPDVDGNEPVVGESEER